MIDLEKFKKEYEEITNKISSLEVIKDQRKFQELSKRLDFLEKIVNLARIRDELLKQKRDLEEIVNSYTNKSKEEEYEILELAKEELKVVEDRLKKNQDEIEDLIFVPDVQINRDIIMEIRAAAGGEEAALFASDLFRMYSRYCERKGWRIEVLDSHPTEIGGFKEIIFGVRGQGCFAHLKYEMGVHRVQRVPTTEASGRIHTSTVTVAVLIEPQELELKISREDLEIETFRASGHGGQHVNVTDSAVRIKHKPTGIVVSCQDERSQIKNREKAMRVLKARLLAYYKEQEHKKISQERRSQVGTGERGEKIRTYNFPERRVTDHRINFTIYRLEDILEGDLDLVVSPLIKEEKRKMYEGYRLV